MKQLAGNNHRYQGFTLIEVLITMIIVAVSLLGLVALQGLSKSSSHEARQRTLAVLSVNDFIDRLRLNKSAWMTQYLSTSGSSKSLTVGTSQTQLTKPDCIASTGNTSATCSTSQLVANDLYQWQQDMYQATTSGTSGALISPVGCLSMTRSSSTNAFNITIVLSWQDKTSAQDASTYTGQDCGSSGSKRRQYVVRTII